MPDKPEQKQKEQRLPDNIKPITDARTIYNNEEYDTKQLQFPDQTGRTAWSVTVTRLKPGKQTRGHSLPDLCEFYQIQRGEGWAILKNQAFEIKPPLCILNLPDSWIKIINTSSTADLIFMTSVAGKYRRPDVKES